MQRSCKIAVLILVPGLIFGLSPFSAGADSGPPDLESVLTATAIEPPQSVRFREERHNPMLKEPMVLTGTMEYLARGKMRKRVETPFQESYLVEPGQVTIERGEEVEVIRGRQGKFIASFLGGIEAVLAGDSNALEESFEIQLEGTPQAWTLNLSPRSKRLARHMQNLVVTGNTERVDSIRVQLDEEFHVMKMIHDHGPGEE